MISTIRTRHFLLKSSYCSGLCRWVKAERFRSLFSGRLKFWLLHLFIFALFSSSLPSVLYCFFEAFPLLYQMRHGFALGVSGLPYIAIIIGTFLTYSAFAFWNYKYITPKFDAGTLTPEDRLKPACVGAICLPSECSATWQRRARTGC